MCFLSFFNDLCFLFPFLLLCRERDRVSKLKPSRRKHLTLISQFSSRNLNKTISKSITDSILLLLQTKGTTSFGKRTSKSHTTCRRCGRRSFHIQKGVCSSCGYPAKKMRRYNWGAKAKRRRTNGTGRMKYLKTMSRRFKNGFREGTQAKKVSKN